MDNRMFCFQCEQTALCTGCTGKAGVCGKTAWKWKECFIYPLFRAVFLFLERNPAVAL